MCSLTRALLPRCSAFTATSTPRHRARYTRPNCPRLSSCTCARISTLICYSLHISSTSISWPTKSLFYGVMCKTSKKLLSNENTLIWVSPDSFKPRAGCHHFKAAVGDLWQVAGQLQGQLQHLLPAPVGCPLSCAQPAAQLQPAEPHSILSRHSS